MIIDRFDNPFNESRYATGLVYDLEESCVLFIEENRTIESLKAYYDLLPKLWGYRSKTWAMKYFEKWYEVASTSGMKAIEDLAAFMKRHIYNILTFCDHGISNAVAEGLNRKIMSIKRQSGGFRNAENFKTAVYFYCGNLNIDPLKTV